MIFTDRSSPIGTSRVIDESTGYLRVPGRVARSGVQYYLRSELGLDGSPFDKVGVFRPESEVFSADYLDSFSGADVTDDHPSKMVNKDSFSKLSVGHVSGVGRRDENDSRYVVADLVIKDSGIIKKINDGKCELSVGYTAVYDEESGTHEGESYDFVQRGMEVNHVAVVDSARAGREAKIFDQKGRTCMSQHFVTLDGESMEVADAASKKFIQKAIDSKDAQIKSLMESVKDAEAEKEKAEAAKDMEEEEKEKEKEAKDAALAELSVYKRKELFDSIAKHDKEFKSTADSEVEIKREWLNTRRKNSLDGKPEAYVLADFDMEMEKEDEEEEKKKEANDSLKNFGSYGSQDTNDGVNDEYAKWLRGGK